MLEKQILRKKHKAQRSVFATQMSPAMAALSFSALPSALRTILEKSSCLAAYIPVGSEANSLKLIQAARDMKLSICLPHIMSKSSPMRFIEWKTNDELIDGPMGLKQPSIENIICEPDVILAPLIAFDRSMTRLGQGSAHYDRALSLLNDTTFIGLGWSIQEEKTLPCDPWDQKMDAILTEREWITI